MMMMMMMMMILVMKILMRMSRSRRRREKKKREEEDGDEKVGSLGGKQGSGPDRSPIEWGDFPFIRLYHPAIQPGLRPSQPGIRPS